MKRKEEEEISFISEYEGSFEDLFHEPLSFYTEWEWSRDISWTSHLYFDCIVKVPMKETYGSKTVEENYKFDMVVHSMQDNGSDLDHFYAFTIAQCESEETKRTLKRIKQFYNSGGEKNKHINDDNLIDEIELLMEDTDDTFLFTINGENHRSEEGNESDYSDDSDDSE
jgi:hypothetical protein